MYLINGYSHFNLFFGLNRRMDKILFSYEMTLDTKWKYTKEKVQNSVAKFKCN